MKFTTNANSRLEQQTVGSRREFDIYDPQSKKKDQPARVGDDDPRCHVSGLQLFQGNVQCTPLSSTKIYLECIVHCVQGALCKLKSLNNKHNLKTP